MITQRFRDQNKTYSAFSGHQLVVCPQCARCADVIVIDSTQKPRRARLTCLHCGYSAQAEMHWQQRKPEQPTDPYFHQPLWLQASCERHILWAYNNDHLHYIRDFIKADLRENNAGMGSGQHNSVVNRLPRWAKLASNRTIVLAIIDKMLKRA